MVILHWAKIKILPEVTLFWWMRCQQALFVESLLWKGTERIAEWRGHVSVGGNPIWVVFIPAAMSRSNHLAVLSKWLTISGSGPPSRSSRTNRSWKENRVLMLKTAYRQGITNIKKIINQFTRFYFFFLHFPPWV